MSGPLSLLVTTRKIQTKQKVRNVFTYVCVLRLSGAGWGLLGVCAMRLQGPGCGWGVVVVSAAALLLLTALGLALALVLTRESPLAPRTARCNKYS